MTPRLLVAAVALGVARAAVAGTCTIEPGGFTSLSHIPSVGDLPSPLPAANGLAIPVDVDPAAGTFVVRRETLPIVPFDSPGGSVTLALAGPPVAGRIDAAGHVRLADWSMDSDFAGLPLPQSPALSTGLKSQALLDLEYPSMGRPLDFATGVLTLDGNDLIPSAPVVSEPVASNFRLTCRLDPVPDAAALPAAATLRSVAGKARLGGDGGDRLAVKLVVAPGAETLDLTGRDVVLQVADAAGTPLLVAVAHDDVLATKGRRRSVKDRDGSAIRLPVGRKTGADTSGALAVVAGRKSIVVTVSLRGLDLAALAGPVQVTLALGDVTVSDTADVRGTGRGRRLH